MDAASDVIKHREIHFCALHPDKDQATTAMLLLSGAEGLVELRPVGPTCLHVSYDVTRISLKIIEDTLTELGFHLDASLLSKLKRALFYYTEETQCANLGCARSNCTREVFISRYERLRHGCRDHRPDYWRKYL